MVSFMSVSGQEITHILKDNPEIDMDQFSGLLVDEDIRAMSITDPKDMPDDTSHRDTSNIVQPHREPGHWLAMLFGKVMSHDWLEFLHELGVPSSEFWRSVIHRLNFFEPLPKMIRRMVDLGPISVLSACTAQCNYVCRDLPGVR
jgi:hypothetical protein